MLLRFARTKPNYVLSSLSYLRTSPVIRFPFSSSASEENTKEIQEHEKTKLVQERKAAIDRISKTNIYVNTCMQKLYRYFIAASLAGISATYIVSMASLTGFPLAYVVLLGFGAEHMGRDYIEKIKPKDYVYKNSYGNIQAATANPPLRKFSFLMTSIGYGSIIGAMLGITPLASSVIPLTAIACIFSNLGHIAYCKSAPKATFKPMHIIISGILAGAFGMNVLTAGTALMMVDSPLNIELLEMKSYLGLVLYNFITGYDTQKAAEDMNKGKGDHLGYASGSSDNWSFALLPALFMNAGVI